MAPSNFAPSWPWKWTLGRECSSRLVGKNRAQVEGLISCKNSMKIHENAVAQNPIAQNRPLSGGGFSAFWWPRRGNLALLQPHKTAFSCGTYAENELPCCSLGFATPLGHAAGFKSKLWPGQSPIAQNALAKSPASGLRNGLVLGSSGTLGDQGC